MVGVPALLRWAWGPSSRITWPSFSCRSRGTPQAHSPALIRAAASSGTLSCGAWLRPSLSSARASSKKPSSSARGRLLPGREAISLVGEAKG